MTATTATKKRNAAPAVTGLIPCDRDRILIVDDEKVIRDLFRRLLSLRLPHCRIDVAVNGAEAVEQFRDAYQGVIMMDLHMPVMDGQTAFAEIQKLCRADNIEMPSVVFCTGYEPPGVIRRLVADNPSHCILQKPVTDTLLLETLKLRLNPPGGSRSG